MVKHRWPCCWLVLWLLALPLWASEALAQPSGVFSVREPGWPDGALGTAIPVDGQRPTETSGVLRSLRAPVSVHVGEGIDPMGARRVLSLCEHTLDVMEFSLGLPSPAPDGTRGGDPGLDLYLTRDGPEVEAVVDALSVGSLGDSAAVFVRARWTPDERELRRRVAEAMARAAVMGANADHPRSVLLALGASIGRMVTGDEADLRALDEFQSEPWRALLVGRSDLAARGAGHWFDQMALSDDDSHRLLGGWVIGTLQKTPRWAVRLWDEPDIFDLASRVFRDEPMGMAGMLLSESVARASDALSPARVSRSLRYGSLPALVSGEPTEPTGMAVVSIDLTDAPLDAAISLWLHASPWRRWVATIVRFNLNGAPIRSLDSGVITNGEWSVNLEVLYGFSRAMLVLVDLGDATYDPDLPVLIRAHWSVHVVRRP